VAAFSTRRPSSRTGAVRLVAALGAAVLAGSLVPAAHAATDGTPTGTRTVSYRGTSVTVPAEWPVRDVAGRPGCVRFDEHAVYLGDPSRSTCPPHLVGRTEAVHLTSDSLQGVVAPDRVVTTADSAVAVVVSAGDDTAAARQVASSVSFEGGTADVDAPAGAADARTLAESGSSAGTAQSGSVSPFDTTYSGLGFDACTAQPLTTMATWFSASPFKAANMYIGGASRGCSQANLTADWVTQTVAQGWTLFPTYVGLQASCSSYPNKIDPAQAAAQGVAAADDAIVQLNALGLGLGNPVYFDMEAFSYTNAGCLTAARTFLGAWTDRLHVRGYVSGIYSSSNTLAAVVLDGGTTPTASMSSPDAIWFARWPADSKTQPGDPTLSDPAIPDQHWANHQRIHQFRGGHQETWGGVTVNIDSNSMDAPLAPSQLAADGAFVQTAGVVYRMAGGAPIVVSDWAAVGGGPQPATTLSQSQFDSLPDRPRDGTFLQSGATGRIWRVVKGVATYVPSWTPYGGPQPSVVVDQAALDNAGTGGPWNRLTSGTPAPRMTGPADRGTTSKKASFTWFGGYSSSAVATYDVRWRKARYDGTYGPWTRPTGWQRTAVSDVPLGLRAGYTSCVAVRARNRAGQLSGWTSQRCTARSLDDRDLVRSSGWTARSGRDAFFGGSYLTTTRKGETLVRTGARLKRVGVVASTCRSCGKVAVLLDGKRIGTVNLAGPRRASQVLMLPAVHRQKATVTLKVRSNGQRVRIDGLVLSRS
jgi:hypothetical protein